MNLISGPVEITKRDSKHHLLWQLSAEKAFFQYENGQKYFSSLYRVKGKLYQKRKTACEVSAANAKLDRANRFLSLQGNVKVNTPDNKTSFECDGLVWNMKAELIKATGNVKLNSDAFTLGPYPVIIASIDLQDIGTPDHFEKNK